jgi:hypothetical protein
MWHRDSSTESSDSRISRSETVGWLSHVPLALYSPSVRDPLFLFLSNNSNLVKLPSIINHYSWGSLKGCSKQLKIDESYSLARLVSTALPPSFKRKLQHRNDGRESKRSLGGSVWENQ